MARKVTVYQVCFVDPVDGNYLSWYATRKEADQALVALERDRDGEGYVTPMDLPLNKKRLIGWLNAMLPNTNLILVRRV